MEQLQERCGGGGGPVSGLVWTEHWQHVTHHLKHVLERFREVHVRPVTDGEDSSGEGGEASTAAELPAAPTDIHRGSPRNTPVEVLAKGMQHSSG